MNRANLQGEYAGFLSRASAFITDLLIISLITAAVSWFIPTMYSQVMRTDLRTCVANPNGSFVFYSCLIITFALVVFIISFPVIYAFFFWILAGQTPGKILFGLRIVRLNGHRMHLGTCIVRYVGYIICLVSLGLGFLNVLINNRRMGWHDMLARTCVIYSWEARQNDAFLDRVRHRLDHRRTNTA